MRLLLASASPRRHALLHAAGWPCEVAGTDVDERREPDESPDRYVERIAHAKAGAAAAHHRDTGGTPIVILAADTAVVVDDEVLGKPLDEADAVRMLRLLSNRAHDVLTAVVVTSGGRTVSAVERTRVWFDAVSEAEVAAYVATGEPLDKAGAYAIQGRAARFIPRIDGSYSNVVGLPVATVARLFEELGVNRGQSGG